MGMGDALPAPPPGRRKQAERSAAMKQRLIAATLDALVEIGYAELTFSHVVERAGVSRGAPLHHFASKAALVEAAAEALVQELSDHVARTWQNAKSSPEPVRMYCVSLWRECFTTRQGAMLAELSYASRHSADLALIVSRLWTEVYQTMTEIDRADTQASGGGGVGELPVPVGRMMMMSQWFMRGMAADAHLGASESLFEAYLDSWIKMLTNQAAC
jgi:AcrR family transcriptional regulator